MPPEIKFKWLETLLQVASSKQLGVAGAGSRNYLYIYVNVLNGDIYKLLNLIGL